MYFPRMSNPARRLLHILGRTMEQEFVGQKQGVVLRSILDLPLGSDDFKLLGKLGRLFGLPAVIASQMRRIPNIKRSAYLGWQTDLLEAFKNVNIDQNVNGLRKALSGSLLSSIELCAIELDKHFPEVELDKNALREILSDIVPIFDRLLAADATDPVTRYLLDHIFKIIEAIENYLLTGSPEIQCAIDEIIGTTFTKPEVAKKAAESNEGQDMWKVVGKIAVFLKLGASALTLLERAQKMLPPSH